LTGSLGIWLLISILLIYILIFFNVYDGLLPKLDVMNILVMYDEKTEQMCHRVEDF